MKVEFYGFEHFKNNVIQQWYIGYFGIMIFGKRFIGFSIKNDSVVINKKTFEAKPSIGVWLYIFFYNIYVEFKNPWRGTKYE